MHIQCKKVAQIEEQLLGFIIYKMSQRRLMLLFFPKSSPKNKSRMKSPLGKGGANQGQTHLANLS